MKKINVDSKNLLKVYITIAIIICIFVLLLFKFTLKDNKTYRIKAVNVNVKENEELISNDMDLKNLKVIAHRGVCNDEPENSMSSIKSSIDHKVDYAEIDVQETKDGVVVLMHDKNLKRLTGVNTTVNRLTYKQIEQLRIRNPLSIKSRDEKIPTLEQVIKTVNHKRKLIIEIKPYGNTVDLTHRVVNLIDENNFTNQCMVHSLSYKILLDVKRQNPTIMTGFIVVSPRAKLPTEGVDFYSVEQRIITPNLVNNIHKSNKTIYAWTVDYPLDMKREIKLNVDGIITDKPTLLLNKKNRIDKPNPILDNKKVYKI